MHFYVFLKRKLKKLSMKVKGRRIIKTLPVKMMKTGLEMSS